MLLRGGVLAGVRLGLALRGVRSAASPNADPSLLQQHSARGVRRLLAWKPCSKPSANASKHCSTSNLRSTPSNLRSIPHESTIHATRPQTQHRSRVQSGSQHSAMAASHLGVPGPAPTLLPAAAAAAVAAMLLLALLLLALARMLGVLPLAPAPPAGAGCRSDVAAVTTPGTVRSSCSLCAKKHTRRVHAAPLSHQAVRKRCGCSSCRHGQARGVWSDGKPVGNGWQKAGGTSSRQVTGS